jgi:HK97 family phage prohead protease
MEYKSFAVEELKADDATRRISGFGSVFGNVDSQGDIVLPGAFAKSIAARPPIMLWQHDTRQPLGVWDVTEEKKKGLYIEGTIGTKGICEYAYEQAKLGSVSGLSIGFFIKKYSIDAKKGVRHIEEVDLYEVSLVTFPANDKAVVTGVKAADGSYMTERQFEEFLRDVGELSQKEAKIVLSDGYKALLRHRDGGAQELEDLIALRDALKQFKP